MTEERATKSVLLSTETVRAKRRYFNALRSLWRIYDEHTNEPTGIHKDMERVAADRLRQAFDVMARHLGGTARARRLVRAVVDYEMKHGFIRSYGEERKAWVTPFNWMQAPAGWRAVHEMVEAIKKNVDELKVEVGTMRECPKEAP